MPHRSTNAGPEPVIVTFIHILDRLSNWPIFAIGDRLVNSGKCSAYNGMVCEQSAFPEGHKNANFMLRHVSASRT